MSTQNDYWSYSYTTLRRNANGTYRFYSNNSGGQLVKQRIWTDTVRRVYPLDGYMLATARSVSTILTSKAVMSYTEGFYLDAFRYNNMPIQILYPTSSSRYADNLSTVVNDPVTSISRESMYNAIRAKSRNEATNLANMLGEYRETAELFKDLAKIIATRGRSLLDYRKGLAGKSRISVPGSLAKNRLAWQYGVRPLAQDIGTAIGEIVSGVKAIPPYLEGVITRRDTVSNNAQRLPSSTSYRVTADSVVIVDTRFRTQWRAYMNGNAIVTSLSDHGMLNPASLAWELMPYSFVIDWWFNVGDVLASIDNLFIIDTLWALDSSSVRRTEYVKPRSDGRLVTTQTLFYYTRKDTRSSPVSIPRMQSLQYKPSLSVGHILNGLALLYVAAK